MYAEIHDLCKSLDTGHTLLVILIYLYLLSYMKLIFTGDNRTLTVFQFQQPMLY